MKIRLLTPLWIACACTVVPLPPDAPGPAPEPKPVPVDDGGAPPGDVYDRACENERRLDCGVRDNCADVFRHAVETSITAVSAETAACIEKAESKEAVRACGYADCP